jgi:NAD(P)-dependent dehydrogenase (short-subunit alcohol dehydrogenase family)
MAAEGACLGLVARGRENLESLSHEIQQAGGRATVIVADCSDSGQAAAAMDEAQRLLGRLDCLVNAAGIHPQWARIGDQPVESWDRTLAVNLSGTFYTCRAALPMMVSHGGGSLVNVTSVAGFRAWDLVGPYNVSKAGVEMLTRTIAHEYAPYGIRANCVAPGVIEAGITDSVLARSPELRETLISMHPMGRLGLAEEVAEATVWLASDASSFTTGASLAVDGGFLT